MFVGFDFPMNGREEFIQVREQALSIRAGKTRFWMLTEMNLSVFGTEK